jgi:hypothetical protein
MPAVDMSPRSSWSEPGEVKCATADAFAASFKAPRQACQSLEAQGRRARVLKPEPGQLLAIPCR